jgi:hypothetical protein
MGIEPTCRAVNARHSDFEDRGHHQVCKHFHQAQCAAGSCLIVTGGARETKW